MKQLESLHAWRRAVDLAEIAYRLTLDAPLNRHFKLADQLTQRLKLSKADATAEAITLCLRSISIIVGLLKKLGKRSRFPFPVSLLPITRDPATSS